MPRTQGIVEQVKATSKKKIEAEETPKGLIPLGSSLFNLACSDSTEGGFSIGKMVNLIGDSSSGKSFIALSIFGEMGISEEFDDYRFIYDDVEAACEFDIVKLFGQKTLDRLEPPGELDEEGEPIYSDTIEAFETNITDILTEGKPFIYVLDSFDALDAEADQKKAAEEHDARKKGKEVKGSYGMAKPKKIGEILRRICRKLKKTKSLLIIVSQTRDDINPMTFTKKTRSGGRALKFYATHEIWTAVAKKLTKKERMVGMVCKAKISKNKLTGKHREVEFPIYYEYGIDDIGSCIDFLVKEGKWGKSGTKIKTDNNALGTATREKLIKMIEDKGLEPKLRKSVGKLWHEIEDGIKLNRKKKYQ